VAPLVLLLLLGGGVAVAALSSGSGAPAGGRRTVARGGAPPALKGIALGAKPAPSPTARAQAWAHRPDPGASSHDIEAYLKQTGFTPYDLYPEWGWVTPAQAGGFGGGASWVAYWSWNNGADQLNWWVNPDGSWGWHHESGGFDASRTLESFAQAFTVVAAALGLVGASQFVYLLHALAGHGSPATLATALKADWDNFQASGNLAQAVKSGDWGKAWDAATKSGKQLGAIGSAWNGHPPDRDGKVT
jgi:hypothetical protein